MTSARHAATPEGLHARLRNATPRLDLSLDLGPTECAAILGRNGAGKSSLLRALAGLLPVDQAQVQIAGHDLTAAPTHRRGISMLTQDAQLFPHMRVIANIAYPLRSHGTAKKDAERAATGWLEQLAISELAQRYPHELSGGQAQLVGIARALAAQPALLLLDEPLRALDIDVAAATRTLLRDVLAARAGMTLLVTHDPADAVALADTGRVVEDGTITARGSLADVLGKPGSVFTARLGGLNLLAVQPSSAGLRCAFGELVASTPPPAAATRATFAPAAVALYPAGVDEPGSPRNRWPVTVSGIDSDASHARIRCVPAGAEGSDDDSLTALLTWAAVADLGIRPGTHLTAVVKATEITVY